MPEQQTRVGELRKEITVEAPLDVAFRVFTQEIGTWWPMKTHTRIDGRATNVVLEGKVGGRLYEIAPGEECDWGVVKHWEPPFRVAFTWLVTPQEGDPETNVEVTFAEAGQKTVVTLVHSGWEKAGEKRAREAVDGYEKGWGFVMGQFAEKVATKAS